VTPEQEVERATQPVWTWRRRKMFIFQGFTATLYCLSVCIHSKCFSSKWPGVMKSLNNTGLLLLLLLTFYSFELKFLDLSIRKEFKITTQQNVEDKVICKDFLS